MDTTGEHIDGSGTKMTRWTRLAAIGMIGLLSASMIWAGGVRGDNTPAPALASAHGHHHGGALDLEDRIVAPAAPTDGVLTIEIPRGTDAAMKASGSSAYYMPSVIRLKVGEVMEIRNDDTAPHIILYAFVMPGETVQRTFTDAGSETYSSGCAANAADYHDFTTIFITAD